MELFKSLQSVVIVPLGDLDFWGWQIGWVVNGVCWLLDLYPLVKKKSLRETNGVMLLPGFIVLSVAVMSVGMLGITKGPLLDDGMAFMEHGACVELLILAVLFMAVWIFAMRLRGSRNDTWKKRLLWSVSYVPDLVIVTGIIVVALARLLGEKFLLSDLRDASAALGFSSYNVFAWIFAYGVVTLLIRLGLLLVAIFARFISMRIPIGTYQENSHPTLRFVRYSAICQNAYLRGVLAFFVAIIGIMVAAVLLEGTSDLDEILLLLFIVLMFAAEGFGGAMIALKPTKENLRRFRKWGDKKYLLEQFCREYFNETPIMRTEDYTLTRNFLVDERSVASVYYLGKLKGWSCCQVISLTSYEQKKNPIWSQCHTVERSKRSGWQWEIYFEGDDVCSIEKEDASVNELLKGINRYWESHN